MLSWVEHEKKKKKKKSVQADLFMHVRRFPFCTECEY